nr:ABC transporter B family member 21-like [Tanacetum cinerariifolium]
MATFVGGFVIAFVNGWFLTLVMLSSIPLLVIAGGIMTVTIAKMAPHGKDAYAKASIVVEQIAGSIRMVASFTRQKKAVKEYNKSLVDAYNTSVHEGLATRIGLGTKHNKNLKKKANKDLESLVKREGTDNPESLGAIAFVDPKMMMLSPATTIDEKSSILNNTASKKRKRNQRVKKTTAGDVFSAKVDEVASGETIKGKTVTGDTTPKKKKKKRNKKKKKVAGDILSAKVDEIVSGETVLDKTVTDNTTPEMKKMKFEADVLSTKVHQVVSGETVPSKTATINTTPKKKKRNKKKRKLKTVAGDILSTCKNVQGEGNAIEGLSATDITESISGEMVSGKTTLPDVKMSEHVLQEKQDDGTVAMHYGEHDECDHLTSKECLPTLPNTVSFPIDFDLEYKFMVQ